MSHYNYVSDPNIELWAAGVDPEKKLTVVI